MVSLHFFCLFFCMLKKSKTSLTFLVWICSNIFHYRQPFFKHLKPTKRKKMFCICAMKKSFVRAAFPTIFATLLFYEFNILGAYERH